MIRPFEIRDIPTLHQYRQRGLFLDSVPTLTWGRTLVPMGAAFSPLSNVTGVFTSIYQDDSDPGAAPIVGQVSHASGASFARFTFIAPDAAIESPALSPLLEHLIQRVGARGAQSLVAEVDEKTHTFEALRRATFSIYSRQRIWRLAAAPESSGASLWRPGEAIHEFDQRRLYNMLVPALVQQVEPVHMGSQGWVLYEDGELRAFASVQTGPRGIWVQPFIHPEMLEVTARLADLIQRLGPKTARPVYICLRSYTAWLADAMQDLGAEPGPGQAVMVRRLATEVRKPVRQALPAINGGAEPVQHMQPEKLIHPARGRKQQRSRHR
ncbi:MAG: hypothetical protein EPO32_13190 [Anaerolineae bacterium]|nr:MAG: hypothetical protein EPO32_13190 [Anaerolineae bacterium]